MKRILLSLSAIIFVGAVVVGATGAFFNDTETSTGNTFTAGAINLKVDSTQHYDGLICKEATPGIFQWQLETPNTISARPELVGTSCSGSWSLKDLNPTQDKFFSFDDVKPGDSGENTISLHIDNNSAYACANVTNIKNNDNTQTGPEALVDANGLLGGELGQSLDFLVWNDNGAGPNAGNNKWDADETGTHSKGAPLNNTAFTLADSGGAPISPTGTSYLGMAWCAGTFTAGGPGVTPTCDGSTMGNIAQTDSYTADISLNVVQSRNNGSFKCASLAPTVGAFTYAKPVAPTCNITVDVNGGNPALDTIQEGVNAATSGQTVCVAPGNYNEFTITKPLTVLGLNDPKGGSAAIVKPSSASVTALALVESSDVTVTGLQFDGSSFVIAGQAAGVQVSPLSASLSNVNVTYNVIKNISATTGFASKGIQWWTKGGSGFALNNSNFKNNFIDNIASVNKGGYGIQTVGAMSNVAIQNNTISNTTGAWGAGVAVDTLDVALTSVAGSSVTLNQIMTGVSNGTSRFAVQVENHIGATGIGIHQNNIETSLHGGGNTQLGTEGILNAQSNWWGTASPVLATDVFNTGTDITDFTLPAAAVFVQN